MRRHPKERDKEGDKCAQICRNETTKKTPSVALSKCSRLALISRSVPRTDRRARSPGAAAVGIRVDVS